MFPIVFLMCHVDDRWRPRQLITRLTSGVFPCRQYQTDKLFDVQYYKLQDCTLILFVLIAITAISQSSSVLFPFSLLFSLYIFNFMPPSNVFRKSLLSISNFSNQFTILICTPTLSSHLHMIDDPSVIRHFQASLFVIHILYVYNSIAYVTS